MSDPSEAALARWTELSNCPQDGLPGADLEPLIVPFWLLECQWTDSLVDSPPTVFLFFLHHGHFFITETIISEIKQLKY